MSDSKIGAETTGSGAPAPPSASGDDSSRPARDGVDAETFNPDTFLTSINDTGTLVQEFHEPEAMSRVKTLHGQITGVVSTLNEKVAKVLQKQEKEFLAAYRAHMYQVQKELQSLRAKANDAELQLKKNEKIRSLEDEKEWYRKEALRLDKFSSQLKSELRFMREKLEAIEEDRNWLERQLKESKKSNKLLKAELEVRMQTSDDHLPASPGGAPAILDEGAEGIWGDKTTSSGTGMFPPPGRPSSQGARSSPTGARSTSGKNAGGRGRGKSSKDRAATAMAMVERLQKELAAERSTVKQLRAATVAGQADRTELEGFFLTCVEDVRKEIARRRTRSLVAANTKGRPGGRVRETSSPTGAATDSFGRGFELDRVKAKAEEPALSDFTATDRRRVMEKLLADDYVLEALHHMIFSAPDPAPLEESRSLTDQGWHEGDGGAEHVGVTIPGAEDIPEEDDDAPRHSGVAGTLKASRIQLEPTIEEYLASAPRSRMS